MKKLFYLTLSIFALIVTAGCAHPINMKPEADKLDARSSKVAAIDKKIAYFIPDTRLNLEVTSPGGGGDLIKYTPYKDMEPGLYKVLSESFSDVAKSHTSRLSENQRKEGYTLMMQPDILTTSSSESILTWPPTKFGITLTCNFYDENDKLVNSIQVSGSGQAEFDEFKKNLSLAANRASTDTLHQLFEAIQKSSELRK